MDSVIGFKAPGLGLRGYIGDPNNGELNGKENGKLNGNWDYR